jgi:hypothetical protein
MPFPLNLEELFGHWESYIVFFIIGLAFGIALEVAGFANSRKLAAQFYFKEMTVLKVMFTAIVVAMVGIFLTAALGLLDYNLLWVNPTFLWPGIVGGLIMGAGFIVGGFCPGTSIVAAGTLKVDGWFFLLGVFFGIFLFGETVEGFEEFWYSSDMGRFTLMELFDVSTGVIVLGVVIMALLAFLAGEQMERMFGDKENIESIGFPKWRYAAAGGIVVIAGAVLLIGQPTTEDRWEIVADDRAPQLEARDVQIHPGEFVELMHDSKIKVMPLDVRDEVDYNLFHVMDAEHFPLSAFDERVADLRAEPANTVFVVMSNDEKRATEAWKMLVAESVVNVYILEGGVNGWVATFADDEFELIAGAEEAPADTLRYVFPLAIGARHPAARPNPAVLDTMEYTKKVELKAKRGASGGGCG